MKRIKVGILGYGNLGKSVESIISNDQRFKLVAIFSRRNVKARFAPVDFSANLSKYKGKIDVIYAFIVRLRVLHVSRQQGIL